MARVISAIQYLSAEEPPFAANLNYSQTRSLTNPEAQILLLLKAGKEKAEIAADVGADEAAVKEHIKAILRKAISSTSQRPGPKRLIRSRPGGIPTCCGALSAQRTVSLGVENSPRDNQSQRHPHTRSPDFVSRTVRTSWHARAGRPPGQSAVGTRR
jgi:DNA-binding CsgD family transcriptional regulator